MNAPRLFAAALLIATSSCASWRTNLSKAEDTAAKLLLPKQDEVKLGLQVGGEVEKKAKLLENPAVVAYVKQVGERVAKASDNPDGWTFTFKVIDDPKTVNAFAIPGGTIYVYTGLLKAAKDEAQLAGVLAHEAAHVTSRHVAKRLIAANGLETVAGWVLGQDPGKIEQIAAAIVVQGTLLKNSRDDESEADAKGVVAASKAGYDPHALVDFFHILQQSEGKTPKLLSYLSDHPATADRIAALERIIAEKRLSSTKREAAALEAVQKQLP